MSRLPDLSSRPGRSAASALDTALAVAGALALAWSAGEAWSAQRALASARSADARLQRGAAAAAAAGRAQPPPAGREAEIGALALTLQAPPPGVFAALAQALPEEVRCERTTLDYGDELRVKLDVVARDAFAYDRFLDRLLRSERFRAVAPGPETRDGAVRSNVSLVFAPEGRP